MFKNSRRCGAVTISAILLFSAFFVVVTVSSTASAYTPHADIMINEASDCVIGNNGIVSGTGTASDPYVISGWQVSHMSIVPGLYESPPVPPIIIQNVAADVVTFTYYQGTVTDSQVGSASTHYSSSLFQNCIITGTITASENSQLTVDECTFTGIGMTETGVTLVADSDGVIIDSTFTGLMYGISRSATGHGDVTANVCTFLDNVEGIHCGELGPATGTIDSCLFQNNEIGIFLGEFCSDFTITGNVLLENGVGIDLDVEVDGCTIFHNNFIDNTVQTVGGDNNAWDDGYPSGGNFWSGHDNTDLYNGLSQDIPGSDGIADSPYHLAGVTALDRYPLTSPFVPLILVNVDIRPGAPSNNINLKSMGQLPVAILGSSELNVGWIDVSSLNIQGVSPVSNVRGVVYIIADVNGDAIADLTVNFRTQSLIAEDALTSSTTSLEVTGSLDAAHHFVPITGSDFVSVK